MTFAFPDDYRSNIECPFQSGQATSSKMRLMYEIVAQDAQTALRMRAILTLAKAEIAALEFRGGVPLFGYDMESVLDLLTDITPACDTQTVYLVRIGARNVVEEMES